MLGRNGQSGCWNIWWKELKYIELEYVASVVLENILITHIYLLAPTIAMNA